MNPSEQDIDDLACALQRRLKLSPDEVGIAAMLTLLLKMTGHYPRTQAIVERAIWAFKHEEPH